MIKNYPHAVIRIRKGISNPVFSKTHKIIMISNKKKTNSQKVMSALGHFRYSEKRELAVNYQKLANFLNKGAILKDSVKRYFLLNTVYNIKKKKKKKRKNKIKWI